ELARRRDQIRKIRMQLRRAAGDIQRRNVRAREESQHRIDVLPAHHLFARRTGFDMAVNARQVAVAAQVDLQDFDPAAAQPVAEYLNLFRKGLHTKSPSPLSSKTER